MRQEGSEQHGGAACGSLNPKSQQLTNGEETAIKEYPRQFPITLTNLKGLGR